MIHYVCKYTPLELFKGFGEECAVLEEMPENFELSDQIAHANLCGFGKSVIQAVLEGKVEQQKISIFICEKYRILLSICIDPERCQKRISQKIKHTVLADRHKESCQITVFICVQQCIGEFFRRKISAFYVCIRIHGFIEGLRQPSARLRILQDLFK